MGLFFSYSIKALLARRMSTFGVAMGVGLAVLVFSATAMLNNSISRMFAPKGGLEDVVVLSIGAGSEIESGFDIPRKQALVTAPEIARRDNQPLASAELALAITVKRRGQDAHTNIPIRGIEGSAFVLRPGLHVVEGKMMTFGTGEAMIGRSVVGRFEQLELGKDFELRRGESVKIVGVFADDSSSAESEVFLDLGQMQKVFGREGAYSSVRLKLNAAGDFDAFKAGVEKDKRLSLRPLRLREYEAKVASDLSDLVTIFGGSVGLFLVVGAMLGALVAMYGSVTSRLREFGSLRAIGFSRFSIVIAILAEGITICGLGAALGVLGTFALRPLKIAMMGPNWSEIVLSFEPSADILITSIWIVLIVGVTGSFLPALKAVRLSIVSALQQR